MKSRKKTSVQEAVTVQRTESASLDGNVPLALDLAPLRSLLERGDVEGARALVPELLARWPDSGQVRHYAQVLAPPQVSIRRGQQGRSRQRERAWLREHAREYPGCWLAVLEGRLIAADADLGIVLAAVRQNPETRAALIHFQPGAPD